jgi:TPR repeat protein
MGCPAATFALAMLYHFGDAMPQELVKAASLYEAAYNNGVTWAARGLVILYEDFGFDNYNPELVRGWLKKFEDL